MATYLDFFELTAPPFGHGGDSRGRLILGTPALRDALDNIKAGLKKGSPRIVVSGGRGMGKTTLALALPKLLGTSVRVVLMRDPKLTWDEHRQNLARQLGSDDDELLRDTLVEARGTQNLLVLVIDAAEQLTSESLERLDALLAFRDDDGRQLLHCVLLADLKAASAGEDLPLLWWLDQLTTLQLEYAPIPEQGVLGYLEKHLQRAGWRGGELFTPESAAAIHRYTGGIPLAISQLADRLLTQAGDRGLGSIEESLVEEVCGEVGPTRPAATPSLERPAASPATSTPSSPRRQKARPRPEVKVVPLEPPDPVRPPPRVEAPSESLELADERIVPSRRASVNIHRPVIEGPSRSGGLGRAIRWLAAAALAAGVGYVALLALSGDFSEAPAENRPRPSARAPRGPVAQALAEAGDGSILASPAAAAAQARAAAAEAHSAGALDAAGALPSLDEAAPPEPTPELAIRPAPRPAPGVTIEDQLEHALEADGLAPGPGAPAP